MSMIVLRAGTPAQGRPLVPARQIALALSMAQATKAIVVMGVSGAGKSTIGAALAARMGCVFVEGDALHPPANVEKMRQGIPLTDQDRAPWLEAFGNRMAQE